MRLLLTIATLAACTPTYEGGPEPCRGQTLVGVMEAIDGDTIDVEIRGGDGAGTTERVRLLGVDTPEVDHNDSAASQCYGVLAWNATIDFAVGEEAYLTFDAECTDTYGRSLAYLYRASDGLFVNQQLIEQGFARTCARSPNDTFSADFAAAEQGAQAEQRGLWGTCDDPAALGECAN